MTEVFLRMLFGVTLGLALVLLLRRPACRVFGAGVAFILWLFPLVLAIAPLLPEQITPRAVIVVSGLIVAPHLATSSAAFPDAIGWAQWLFVIWLVGVVGASFRLAVHYVRLLRGLRRVPQTWGRMLAEAAPNLHPRRVYLHDAGPAVLWAVPRSLILLPADFPQRFINTATRELVIRHELTHARRGDAWWSLAMEIASVLLWFHPLAWVARPRFRLDQELACDAASLRALPERNASYARALIDSVAVQVAPVLIPWLAEPQLKERIAMISRIPPGALRRRAGFLAVAAIFAGGLYVVGGQASVQAATHAPSKSTPPPVDITYKNRNPPHYPAEAIKKGQQGMVLLDITVDATGKVTSVQIDQHGTDAPAELQVAALQAAASWKFNSGRKNGKSIGGVIQVPVNFSLNEDYSSEHSPKPCPVGSIYLTATSECVKSQPPSTSS